MESLKQVVFKLDNEEYGVDIIKVNGIEKYQEITKVPNAPEYIEGMINLRGEVLPIFSLRKKFNLTFKEYDEETRIIVAMTNDIKVGMIVDSVSEIMNIDEEQVESVPKLVAGIDRRYIKSVAKVDQRMIVLVDVDLLIDDEEKISLGQVVDASAQ